MKSEPGKCNQITIAGLILVNSTLSGPFLFLLLNRNEGESRSDQHICLIKLFDQVLLPLFSSRNSRKTQKGARQLHAVASVSPTNIYFISFEPKTRNSIQHNLNQFETKTTTIAANRATSIPETLSLVSCCYGDIDSKATATS